MKAALYLFAIVVYLFSAIYPTKGAAWVLSGASLLIIIVAIREVKGFVRGLGAFFLLAGFVLFLMSGLGGWEMFRGFGQMLNILSLFAIIPLIALPVQLGQYAVRLQEMIQRNVRHTGVLYSLTSMLSYLLSSFMNIATLPMMYHSIRPSLNLFPIEQKDRFISRAITHGFAMPTVWTPVTPIVGIIIEMTGAQWSSILSIVIPFSLAGLLLDIVMGVRVASRRHKSLASDAWNELAASIQQQSASMPVANSAKASHPAQIVLGILLFNALIFTLERTTDLSFLLIVTISVIPFAFAWSLFLGKGRAFLGKCKETIPQQVLKMKDQFFVFLSAGFMISAIQASGVGHEINEWIHMVKVLVGSDVFLAMVPFIPLALAFVGLHPAVALALTAESLNPAALGISVELTAIALLIGASTAFLMGPYNATIGLMANLCGQSNYRVSNWNAPFTLVYIFLGILLLLILKNGG